MPWIYAQTSGDLTLNGVVVGSGYSGAGATSATGRNNPTMQHVPNHGPIPAGTYEIGPAYNHPRKGPASMNLTPVGHAALGRSGFMIHGNNAQNDASQGCIILGRRVRQLVAINPDKTLEVRP